MKDRQKVIAGLVILGVAAVIAIAVVGGGDEGDGGGASADLACTLASSGALLLATGLTEGKSAGAIVTSIGGPAVVGYGCSQGIKAMVNTPDKPVDLTVENPDGTTAEETVTGTELAQPPPETASSNTCFDWNSLVLFQWCLEGTIGPPP